MQLNKLNTFLNLELYFFLNFSFSIESFHNLRRKLSLIDVLSAENICLMSESCHTAAKLSQQLIIYRLHFKIILWALPCLFPNFRKMRYS